MRPKLHPATALPAWHETSVVYVSPIQPPVLRYYYTLHPLRTRVRFGCQACVRHLIGSHLAPFHCCCTPTQGWIYRADMWTCVLSSRQGSCKATRGSNRRLGHNSTFEILVLGFENKTQQFMNSLIFIRIKCRSAIQVQFGLFWMMQWTQWWGHSSMRIKHKMFGFQEQRLQN